MNYAFIGFSENSRTKTIINLNHVIMVQFKFEINTAFLEFHLINGKTVRIDYHDEDNDCNRILDFLENYGSLSTIPWQA